MLVAIYGIFHFIQSKRGENTFRTNVIPKVDSGKVNAMLIYTSAKRGEPMKFTRKNGKWMVTQGGYTTLADDKAESYVIEQVGMISPDRLATGDPGQWKEYNLTDTGATRVVLLNNTDTLLDMLVGRFGFNGQARQGISYMRMHGHDEVYGVEGFLALNITQDVDSWRDRKAIYMDPHAWTKLTFNYPGDSSFTIQKDSNEEWHFADGKKTDSAATAATLTTMSQQNYGKFDYKFDTNSSKPVYTLQVEGKEISTILLKAYPADTANEYIITSTINPGAYFSEKKSKMLSKLFVGKKSFLYHKMPKAESTVTTVTHKQAIKK